MLKELGSGIAAGALGTLVLNVTTYLDMALRGRAASEAPAELVTLLAEKAGLPLAPQNEKDPEKAKENKKTAKNRASAMGALLGYVTGLGIGSLYGVYRAGSGRKGVVPGPLVGITLGLAVMAASDTPLIVTGISKPEEWGFSGWVADIIPHVVYGLVTTAAYDALNK